MSRAPRILAAVFILLADLSPGHAGENAALERGTAITDPLALRELDRGRFGVSRMLEPMRSADLPLVNSQLFALPSMEAVRPAIDREFDRYIARKKADQ